MGENIIGLQTAWLEDWDAEAERGKFHWRCCKLAAAACGPIRLRDNSHDIMVLSKKIQGGEGKSRRAHEDNAHGAIVARMQSGASLWPRYEMEHRVLSLRVEAGNVELRSGEDVIEVS